jgi:hypothetical protein
MLARDGAVWINDGGEEKNKGSRLLALDQKGTISVPADLEKLLPVTGFDMALVDFGNFGGQILRWHKPKSPLPGQPRIM